MAAARPAPQKPVPPRVPRKTVRIRPGTSKHGQTQTAKHGLGR